MDYWVSQGWQCPRCARIYSPFTTMCFSCVPQPTRGGPAAWVCVNVDGVTQEVRLSEPGEETVALYEKRGCRWLPAYTRDSS